MQNLQIVLSSDWRRHWTMNEIEEIFIWNGVCRTPIGFTSVEDCFQPDLLEANRSHQIMSWVESNRITDWCAVDDLDLSKKLGDRFVWVDPRMGIRQNGAFEKLIYSIYTKKTI